jgi:phage protein D/phage baseplate assembly protein gpV
MAETFGARPMVYLDGNRLTPELEAHLRRVEITSDVHAPDACRIVLDDPGRTALADAGFEFHAKLEVKAARTGEAAEQSLFIGKVYHLGFEYDAGAAVTVVGAFDGSYALCNGLKTATYCNVTDADLARQLAQAAGLTAGEIESTSVVHEHLSQVNETDWSLLLRRAREIDFDCRVVGDKLDFKKSAEAQEAPEPGDFQATDRLQLTPGGNLEQLTVRVTAAQQVTEVEVRGWDPKRKEGLVATAPARSREAAAQDAPDALANGGANGGGGSPRHVTATLPLTTQAGCDAAAASEAERVASTSVHAEGVARGDPRIVSGVPVSIGQTGGRFDGKFTITTVRHVFGPSGYRIFFTASGRQDRSVLGLLNGAVPTRPTAPPGVVIGVVTNISDPDKLGRVKLKFPWLSDDYESFWARVVYLGAGVDRGLLLPPEVNDEVVCVFEQGDVRSPIVIGGLYNGVDTAPKGGGVDASSGKVVTRALRSRKGNELVLIDTDGGEKIELRTPDGKTELVMDHAGGKITVHAEKDVVVDAGGDVKVDAKGNASVKASGNVRLEANGSGTFKANSGLTLESSGTVTVKGAAIRLN